MQANQMLTELFGFSKTINGLIKPLLILVVIMMLMMPRDAKKEFARQYVQAVFSYLMMAIGVILMSFGAVPTLTAVISKIGFSAEQYLGLLLVFSTGGILYLWMDQQVRYMDESVRMMPRAVFHTIFKIVGHLAVLFAAVALAMAIAFGATATSGWWTIPLVTLLYGSVLCWLTASEQYRTGWLAKMVDSKLEETARPKKKK